MYIVVSLCLLVLLPALSHQYMSCIMKDQYMLEWTIDPDVNQIHVQMSCMKCMNGTASIGIGDAHNGTIVMGYRDDDGFNINQYYIQGKKVIYRGHEGLSNFNVRVDDDDLVLKFSRRLTGNDVVDIKDAVQTVFFATTTKPPAKPQDYKPPEASTQLDLNMFVSSDCGGHDMGHGMTMYFYWGWHVMMVFDGWMTHTFGQWFLAACFTFMVSFVLQLLNFVMTLKLEPKKTWIRISLLAIKIICRWVGMLFSVTQMLLMMTFNVPLILVIATAVTLGWVLTEFVIKPSLKMFLKSNGDYKGINSDYEDLDCCAT